MKIILKPPWCSGAAIDVDPEHRAKKGKKGLGRVVIVFYLGWLLFFGSFFFPLCKLTAFDASLHFCQCLEFCLNDLYWANGFCFHFDACPCVHFSFGLWFSGWNYGLNPKGLSMVMTAYKVWWPTLQQVLVYSVYHSLPLSNKVLWVNNAGNIIDGVRGWFSAFEQLYH